MKYLGLALLLGACAAPNQNRAPAAPPAVFGVSPSFGASAAPPPATTSAAQNPPPALAPAAPLPLAPGANTSAPVGSAERHGPPLPELSVKSFGLHIGGGGQDAAARDEFLRVLESATGRYLECYRLVEQPGSVGTFGADLTIGGAGGKPKVGKPRTKLRGDEFHACMLSAFEGVSFPRTPSGRAVVVSYSVKFNLN